MIEADKLFCIGSIITLCQVMADVSLVMAVKVEWLSPVSKPKYGSNREPLNLAGNSER